jgi:hypothetical protein
MSLATGACISRHKWTELPITDTAIARVEALVANEEQPLIQEQGLVVEWAPGQPIDDDEYDRNYVPVDNQDDEYDEGDDYEPIDQDEITDLMNEGWPVEQDGMDNIRNGTIPELHIFESVLCLFLVTTRFFFVIYHFKKWFFAVILGDYPLLYTWCPCLHLL